jgi:hypothetical protein
VPDPPAGAVAEPVQMSGMPLQVGDLPPGIIVVRVIRRSFADNVANQRVELRAVPSDNAVTAVTDDTGRAQFSGQSIGTMVRASAVVDGERLESQVFEIPAQGGVRMVLVAGVGAGVVGGAVGTGRAEPGSLAGLPERVSSSPSTKSPGAGDLVTFSVRRTTLIALAVFGVGGGAVLIAFAVWRRRGESPPAGELARSSHEAGTVAADRAPESSQRQRSQALQDLVTIEKAFAAGRFTESEYVSRREALVTELVALDAQAPLATEAPRGGDR